MLPELRELPPELLLYPELLELPPELRYPELLELEERLPELR
jgi:hypothetical protein